MARTGIAFQLDKFAIQQRQKIIKRLFIAAVWRCRETAPYSVHGGWLNPPRQFVALLTALAGARAA